MTSPAQRLAATKPEAHKARYQKKTHIWQCGLREQRKRLGLTQRDVADAIGMTVAGLWAIEHGSDPMLTTAKRIADFFGCSIEDMWSPIGAG